MKIICPGGMKLSRASTSWSAGLTLKEIPWLPRVVRHVRPPRGVNHVVSNTARCQGKTPLLHHNFAQEGKQNTYCQLIHCLVYMINMTEYFTCTQHPSYQAWTTHIPTWKHVRTLLLRCRLLKGPEMPTYVGLQYRGFLPLPVQWWHQPAKGFLSTTWWIAIGVCACHVYPWYTIFGKTRITTSLFYLLLVTLGILRFPS